MWKAPSESACARRAIYEALSATDHPPRKSRASTRSIACDVACELPRGISARCAAERSGARRRDREESRRIRRSSAAGVRRHRHLELAPDVGRGACAMLPVPRRKAAHAYLDRCWPLTCSLIIGSRPSPGVLGTMIQILRHGRDPRPRQSSGFWRDLWVRRIPCQSSRILDVLTTACHRSAADLSKADASTPVLAIGSSA